MSGAEAAPGSMAAADAAPALPPPDFLQQRLAAVAAVPVEQRSHDEAGFLRAHQLLAAAQESLAALGSPAAEADAAEPDIHFALATLSLLGGLEELCSIGVSLQWALNLHSRVLYGLARRARALQRSADEMLGYSIVSALVQFHYETDLLRDDTPPEADERPEPATWPNSALLLEQLHSELYHDIFSQAYELTIPELQPLAPCTLPSLAQLQRLAALFSWQWAAQLACGLARPSWMAGYPGPTRDEAGELQLRALAAMRQLRPSHPLTTRMAVQTRLAGVHYQGPPVAELLHGGVQQAAAAGGPHGSSMFTAEFSYGLISSSAPTEGMPPWGSLTLAESAQLVEQGDAALARCKALLPPAYLTGLKNLSGNASVRWTRAAVERHRQAGADEWRQDLVAAEPPPEPTRDLFAAKVKQIGHKCAGCSKFSLDLKSCSACKQAKYCSKECQVRHWASHKAHCRATRAAAVQQAQQGPAAGESGTVV